MCLLLIQTSYLGSDPMLSDKLLAKLNDQMNYEFYSSQVYLAMAAYCSSESFDGFANFFIVQSEEEKFHGMKIYHFINALGKRAIVSGMDHPQNEYGSLLDAFEHSYEHEQTVTKRIYELSDIAWDEREHATINFLKWFIDEQVEKKRPSTASFRSYAALIMTAMPSICSMPSSPSAPLRRRPAKRKLHPPTRSCFP